MNFILKCETYVRLATVCLNFHPLVDNETKELLNCVRLEYKNGHYYAVSTNKKIASIQYLGVTNEADSEAHIIVNEQLIEQCKSEAQYDSHIEIMCVPEIQASSFKTLMGYAYQGNACIFPDDKIMSEWREWAPDKPVTKTKGIQYWNADNIAALAASSPSGAVFFPEHIDTDKPVIMRDLNDPNWCGLFMAEPGPNDRQVKDGAELPTWWK